MYTACVLLLCFYTSLISLKLIAIDLRAHILKSMVFKIPNKIHLLKFVENNDFNIILSNSFGFKIKPIFSWFNNTFSLILMYISLNEFTDT